MAENPYMLIPEEQLLYAAQDPAHPFIDPQVVSTPIEFALNPQKYRYRNWAEAGSAILEKAAPYILYNMSPGGVPVTASRNIAADWQNPYMSGLEKGANTLSNLLNVAMMAAPSQMGQAGASALNTIGQKAGAYAGELAPIMKNVAKSEVGGVRLLDEKPLMYVPSQEGLSVELEISLLYKLDAVKANEIYKTVGPNYVEIILVPQFRSVVRGVTARYEAKALYTASRERLAGEIVSELEKLVGPRGITVEQAALRQIKLPPRLTQSIEEKLQAEQESQRMAFILL